MNKIRKIYIFSNSLFFALGICFSCNNEKKKDNESKFSVQNQDAGGFMDYFSKSKTNTKLKELENKYDEYNENLNDIINRIKGEDDSSILIKLKMELVELKDNILHLTFEDLDELLKRKVDLLYEKVKSKINYVDDRIIDIENSKEVEEIKNRVLEMINENDLISVTGDDEDVLEKNKRALKKIKTECANIRRHVNVDKIPVERDFMSMKLNSLYSKVFDKIKQIEQRLEELKDERTKKSKEATEEIKNAYIEICPEANELLEKTIPTDKVELEELKDDLKKIEAKFVEIRKLQNVKYKKYDIDLGDLLREVRELYSDVISKRKKVEEELKDIS